jgi:hypothetical protein
LIDGTSAAGLTAIVSPFSKPTENQVIRTPEQAEELDINAKANQEAILLMGDPADQTQNERITKLKEIESVIANNETLMSGLEPNAPERSKLDLENRVAKKEAEKLKAEITQGAGLSETITTIEEQQAALAGEITKPAPKPLPTDSLPTETPSATYGREEQVYDVFGDITRKPVAIPKPAELPAAPTIEEQTAEGTYGGQTGVFDVFAGARRKPVITEEPPVSMVGKEVIPGVTPVPVVTEPTIKESLPVAPEAPAIEEEPMSVSDEKEFAELNDLMGRKGQAENKVRGVKFTKQDQSRYQNLLTKFRDRLIETTDPKNDPVVGTDINGTPIQQSNKGTFYTFENGRVRTGPAFSEATPAPVTEQAAPAEAPAPEVAPVEEKLFQPDDELVMRSPYTGEDTIVSYRGKPSDGQAVVWTGKMQMQIPEFWLRKKGEEFTEKETEGAVAPKIVAEEIVQETPKEEVEKPLPKTKKGLVEELAGEEPKDYALAQDWKRTIAALNKQTKEELAFKVSNNREQDKKFKATQKITSELFPKIKETVDAAGTKWVQALKTIASENGLEKWTTLEGNSKGEEIYRLANRIASSQINAPKVPAPAVSETITPAAVPAQPTKKTRLDIILDKVENTSSEVTIEVPEKNRTREGIERMIKVANDRGLEASFDGRFILFRPPIREVTSTSKPKLGEKGGVLIPTKEDVRYNPLGYDIAEQKKTTPKTYAQLENEALDIQNQISTETGVSALIGVSDDNLTISGLESREKGKGTKALEIITSAADKNQTTITLKAEPKSGDVQRLKKLYSRFGFVDDPNFAEGSNRMIRFPAATPAPVTEQAAPAEAPAPEVAPAEQVEMPKDFEITGKKITKISTENGIESATKDYASALNKKGIKTEISYDVTTTIGFDTVTKTKKRITSNDNVSSGNIITPQGKLVILSDGSVNVFKPIPPTPAVSETITEPVTPTRKEAKFPTMPSIEEQTAEKVYGGETGLYDPFAGVQKKRTKAEDPIGRRGTEDQIKNADEHAAEIGGTVLYQDGDISLIRGYSLWGGTPVYIVANKGSRSRTDISSYTGNLTTPEQKVQLVDIKNKIEAEDQSSFNNKPFITFTDGISFSNNVPSAIAGVLKGWKSLLNIKANLYVTTYEDAVADKDKFNGPHRVIGSAGLASSKTDGSIRKMPNGDFYIMFRGIPSRTKMLETLAHELGHLHEKEAFENADTATKKMLRDEHDKWVKSQTGKTAQELVSSLRAVKSAKANMGAAEGMMADELSAYWKSFGEWYADQVSRWAVSAEKPLTIVDKFFSKIAKALKTFYSKITNQGYLPNETFVQYLEKTLNEPERIVSEPITVEGEAEQLSQQLGEQPSKTTRRTRIMSVEAGEEVETQEAIIARTKDLLRKQFDPTKVTEKNTTEAFRALGKLAGNRKEALAYAEELNDIGRLVDKSGAASEISMGAALFVNDLFEYSIRLAAEGDSKMLGIMMANINRLPTAMIGASDAGRTLAARAELKARFSMMGRAEQDAYTNYVAEFIYGPNPTKEQIQSIKDAYAAVEKTPQVTEQELTDELESVGGRTGTDLVGKINEEFTKATDKGRQKRKTEEAELDEEYKKVQRQADAEIEKLAKIQSDTPSFDPAAARQTANDVRAIVANDLKQRPDMGRKAPWKSMLVAKLQEAGVELTAAETLADIVWRQHEINSLSRELSSINKAIEKGPISEIVKAIKDTPLEDQQNPNWRYEVMRDYLRRAGLNVAQSERIAKLMDISLQKRFTMAQEQAFTDAISKTAPWKSGDTRSRRAFQKVLQALRAGALDPARNVLSDMAALNGWTGFTPEQYKDLLKYDAILADPESADATKAQAHKVIQDIISKAKLPIRARDVIGQYYDAQALSGIPTVTVNIFSPAGVAVKNALTQALNGVITARPEQITASLTTFLDSIKSWANTVAFSFKNNVTVYSNVEYLVNDEGLLKLYKKGVDQFNNGKTPRDRADGVKNMMVGMMDYVRRVLNALDYGAIASLQNQSVSKYALAAMQAKGMSSKDGAKMLNAMMEAKRDFYNKQIAIGTDKNKAAVLADEFFISSWRQALTDAKLPAQQVMDAALNDAMSAVGRNRQSLDAFREEETNIRDNGVTSFPAIWLLETMANAANKQDSQFIKIFSRVIYGFAIVPARVLRETAWFSPYGAVRFAYDAIAKKMGKTSPYAQSLGNDLQYRQRLTETIAGSLVMLAFAAAMSSSTEDEDDEKPFKIVVTGNGPLRNEDPQYYDSWVKKNRANTVSVYFGKTKFTLNTMRGFEAFAWPAMMLGAVDDWHIRRKQKRETNTPVQMQDAAIVAGNVLSASLRRGPYAFAAKPLFEAYGDRGVESLAKSLAFPAKTIIPVLGSSLASNLSNFLNEPIDRKTLEGALWANVPFIGPAVAPKSLNAFGEPAMANDAADKIFKLGVPIVFDIPTDRDSVNLHELVLKQGGGPSIPTRNQLAQRLDRQPTNKEYEMFAKEYGAVLTTSMKKNYEKLSAMKPEAYTKVVERIGNRARDIAENKVRVAAKKP